MQTGAESLFQEAQAVQVFAANAGSRLDLEGDDLAVVALEDEVYFVAALGPEVPDSDDPGAKGGTPGRKAVNEEDGFEKLDVVLSRGPLQADRSGDRSYAEYLPSPGGKLAQRPGQHLALSDSRDVRNVFVHYQVHVVGEPPRTRPAWRAAQGRGMQLPPADQQTLGDPS